MHLGTFPERILKLWKSVNFYFSANTNMPAVGCVWGRFGGRTQSEKNWWIWEMDLNHNLNATRCIDKKWLYSRSRNVKAISLTQYSQSIRINDIKWHALKSIVRYCLINIACFWIFDVLPISVTALLPYILFPSLGLMSSGAVAAKYMSNTNLLLVGGFMIAIAIEETGLHQVTDAFFEWTCDRLWIGF